MAAVSSTIFGGRTIRSELERFDAAGLFRLVTISADHGRLRPSSTIFEEALAGPNLASSDVRFAGYSCCMTSSVRLLRP